MVSDHNWQFVGRATAKAPAMLVPRGKVTGGSSAINGQVFLRGVPEDYDAWAAQGNDEWQFEHCFEYFRKIETDLDFGDDSFMAPMGRSSPAAFGRTSGCRTSAPSTTACPAAGFSDSPDHNHPHATGIGPIPCNNPDGIRWSTALGYLNLARHRLNLTIRPNCMVQRLLFDGNRAVGVEVESGGERFIVEGEEIILSAGAVGSPHLLLLSGRRPAERSSSSSASRWSQDLPGVGQNLRDHPMVYITWRTRPEHPLDGLAPRVQLALRWTAEGSELWNDLMIFMMSFATERVDRGGDRMTPLGIRMLGVLDLAMSAGELRLQSTDPNVQPFLDYRYLEDEFDRRRMREIVRLAVGARPTTRNFGRSLPIVSSQPTPSWPATRRSTSICCGRSRPASTSRGPARWGRPLTRWRWWTSMATCTACRTCAWSTPRSCRTAFGPTPTSRR